MNIEALERELAATQTEGLALVASTARTAEAENREYTDAERAAIKVITDRGLDVKGKIARAKGDQGILSELERLTSTARPANTGPRRSKSLGEQFVASGAYEFFRKQGHRASGIWTSPSVELDANWSNPYAATLTEDPASGGSLVVPQYLPGIQALPTKRLMVADLFAPGTTDSNRVVYMREKTYVNAAAGVLEGAVKPESTLTFEAAGDDVRKIAHWLPVSEEMLEDVAQIRSYIDARLRLGVQMEEEDQLLNGTGIAPELAGLLTRAGLAAAIPRADPATNADAIFAQIMAIFATSFLMPNGIVIHPSNWAATLMQKTSTGEYMTGGPFSPIQTPTLWGLPVAVTPSVVAGTGVVGAFKTAGQVFRKGGIRVEASNSHADFFVRNLVAIRAEERLALAVYRPGAFGTVTNLSTGPIVVP